MEARASVDHEPGEPVRETGGRDESDRAVGMSFSFAVPRKCGAGILSGAPEVRLVLLRLRVRASLLRAVTSAAFTTSAGAICAAPQGVTTAATATASAVRRTGRAELRGRRRAGTFRSIHVAKGAEWTQSTRPARHCAATQDEGAAQ
jgi:hypothetical protein